MFEAITVRSEGKDGRYSFENALGVIWEDDQRVFLLQNVRNMLNEDCPQLFKELYPVFFVFDIDDAERNRK